MTRTQFNPGDVEAVTAHRRTYPNFEADGEAERLVFFVTVQLDTGRAVTLAGQDIGAMRAVLTAAFAALHAIDPAGRNLNRDTRVPATHLDERSAA